MDAPGPPPPGFPTGPPEAWPGPSVPPPWPAPHPPGPQAVPGGWAPAAGPPLPLAGEVAVPVAEAEREVVVDVLRAVALLGIVVVNVAAYRRGVGPTLSAAAGEIGGEVTALTAVLAGLLEGRFYPLFSFLFGWGFAVQDARSRMRGRSVVGPWLRRCGALLVLGLLHGLLLFDGDILVTYALIGVFLLVLRSVPAGWLAGIGATLVTLQALFTTLLVVVGAASVSVGSKTIAEVRADARARLAEDAATFSDGSFLDVVRHRAGELALDVPLGLLTVGGTVAGMMVLGMAVQRVGWVDPRRWPRWLQVGLVPAWLVGLAISVPGAWQEGQVVFGTDDAGAAAVGWLAYSLLGPLVALGWAGAIVLAYDRTPLRRVLAPLAPAGRMSLTLYLSQSLVASLVFNGYGLGLGEDVGIGGAVLLVVALWAVQVLLATLWFRFFTMGPVEALTRAVAYLRWPVLRRQG